MQKKGAGWRKNDKLVMNVFAAWWGLNQFFLEKFYAVETAWTVQRNSCIISKEIHEACHFFIIFCLDHNGNIFLWTSSEILMHSFCISIEILLNSFYFFCIFCSFYALSYEFLLHFLWISYAYAFLMNFLCISYACLMQFLCNFKNFIRFGQKCMKFWQKCMKLLKLHRNCIRNANELHKNCIRNA